jgi:hypothetical protein
MNAYTIQHPNNRIGLEYKYTIDRKRVDNGFDFNSIFSFVDEKDAVLFALKWS